MNNIKNELITVIIPAYNCEKFIDKCIQSIVNQTYRELEIIIIDDGSKDNTYEKCLVWAEKDGRIKVIHQENKGIGNARNAGLRTASGKYIGFVDADDEIDQRMYEILVNNIKKCDGDISIIGFYDVFNNHKEHHQSLGNLSADQDDITFACLSRNISLGGGYNVAIWNKLFLNHIIFNPAPILFKEDIHVGEDAVWLINVIDRVRKGAIDPTPLYYYKRIRKNSALDLRDSFTENTKDDIKAITYVFEHIKRQKRSKKIYRCAANRLYEHNKNVHWKFHSLEDADFRKFVLKNINIGFWHGKVLSDEISFTTKLLSSLKYFAMMWITFTDIISDIISPLKNKAKHE